MAGNVEEVAQARVALAATRMGKARGDRAQVAATLRWLRELKPVQRRPLPARRAGGNPG
jgi:hypothetical protein